MDSDAATTERIDGKKSIRARSSVRSEDQRDQAVELLQRCRHQLPEHRLQRRAHLRPITKLSADGWNLEFVVSGVESDVESQTDKVCTLPDSFTRSKGGRFGDCVNV